MEPSAITSAPAPTVLTTVRSRLSAYTCWPERTGLACMRPGPDLAGAGLAAAGAGSLDLLGLGVDAGAGSSSPRSYCTRNLASKGRPSACDRVSVSLVP